MPFDFLAAEVVVHHKLDISFSVARPVSQDGLLSALPAFPFLDTVYVLPVHEAFGHVFVAFPFLSLPILSKASSASCSVICGGGTVPNSFSQDAA